MQASTRAYRLFTSSARHPLYNFLSQWRAGKLPDVTTAHALTVVALYLDMMKDCDDGRYNGRIRSLETE